MSKNSIKKIISLCLVLVFATNSGFAISETDTKSITTDKKTFSFKNVFKTKEKNKKEKKQKLSKDEKEKLKYSDYYLKVDKMVPDELKDERLVIEGSVSKTFDLTLANCIELALKYNPQIKSAYAEAGAINTHKGQIISNYVPRLDLSANILRTKPDVSSFSGMAIDPFSKYTLGSIGVKQLVYDFGITQNYYSIYKIEYESALQKIEDVVNSVICDVKSSYYALITSNQNYEVMKNSVQHFEETYNQAVAFYQVGFKPKIDVTIAATNLADARAKFIEAKNTQKIATAQLNNVLGLPFLDGYIIDETLPFSDEILNFDEIINIANENRPGLKIAVLSIKKADEQIKLAKKIALPSLEFKGNLAFGGRYSNDMKNWFDLGGYLTFPTINPLLIKTQIDEAKKLYEKQQFDSKTSVNDIYYEIQSAYAKLVNSQEKVPVALYGARKAKENYELSFGRYKVGEADAIELKDALLQYQTSELNYYESLFEFNQQKAILERSIGQTLKSENSKHVSPKINTPVF